jgi:hypothetical protein
LLGCSVSAPRDVQCGGIVGAPPDRGGIKAGSGPMEMFFFFVVLWEVVRSVPKELLVVKKKLFVLEKMNIFIF